jgi:DNA-binding transcriptional ArsR family regulator
MSDTVDQFTIVPRYVVEEAPASVGVYAAVRMYANYETGECWPAIDTIATTLEVSRRTVERHLARLVAIGAVEKVSRKAEGRSNLYRFPAARIEGYVTDVAPGTTPESQRGTTPERDEQDLPEPDPENHLAARRRDLLWEAFEYVHGQPATAGERGKYAAAVAKLREARVEPAEYPRLVAAYTSKHNGLQPGVMTVAQRVGELRHYINRGPIATVPPDQAEREREWAALESQL